MDAITKLQLDRHCAQTALEAEQKAAPYADGPAVTQTRQRIADLYQKVQELDGKIAAAKEIDLCLKDTRAAIDNAVHKSNIQIIMGMLDSMFALKNYDTGMTPERVTVVRNEMVRALRELV